MSRVGISVVLLMLTGHTVVISSQRPSPPAPAFEVASVKRNVSGRAGGSIQVPPAGELSFTNVMLRILIREAYQVDAYAEPYKLDAGAYADIIGRAADGPQPQVPRFDVRAKPPGNTAPAERRAMMRTLLEDRFRLRVHRETRQMPVYALTVAREGRLGPQLAPSQFDCDAYLSQRRAGRAGTEPVDAKGNSWCLPPADMSRPDVYTLRFAGPVRVLMQRIQPYVDRAIVDATGLSGNLEWNLTFSWRPKAPADVPEIFTGLQEQLGLRLEPRQGLVEVLVVDSVALPTPD